MKRILPPVLALFIAGGLFAQEYTLHYSGEIQGLVTITKDAGGVITILPRIQSAAIFSTVINAGMCPALPREIEIRPDYQEIVVDRNTTTWTYLDGGWSKEAVEGNTSARSFSDGIWEETVVEGNTSATAFSDGSWRKTVVEGNTSTTAFSDGSWFKEAVEGNIATTTYSDGYWEKKAVNGNTTMETSSAGWWRKTVVTKQGNGIYINITAGGG